MLLQRMRGGIKNFDWAMELPNAIKDYNSTFHKTLKATPEEVFEGEKDNPVEKKVVESVLKKGMRVRIKIKKSIFDKGVVSKFSKDIYQTLDHKGKLKNLNTGDMLNTGNQRRRI